MCEHFVSYSEKESVWDLNKITYTADTFDAFSRLFACERLNLPVHLQNTLPFKSTTTHFERLKFPYTVITEFQR